MMGALWDLHRARFGRRDLHPVAILADDMTGALDAAAPFCATGRTATVLWREGGADGAFVTAWDGAMRELPPPQARRRTAQFAAILRDAAPDAVHFLKIDSLLRGAAAAMVAAMVDELAPRACVMAPAYPAHGRLTRHGRQFVRQPDHALAPCPDIAAALAALGYDCTIRDSGDAIPPGISLWNAEADADLDRIVAADCGGPILWVGSGGLAAALARRTGAASKAAAFTPPQLALVGTNHPATVAQIAGTTARLLPIDPADGLSGLAAIIASGQPAVLTANLPGDASRSEAAKQIAQLCTRIAPMLGRARSLLVTGGETLRALCEASGAEALDLLGEVETGVPVSTVRGGCLDGITLVSKSGGFGDPGLFARLLANPECKRVPA